MKRRDVLAGGAGALAAWPVLAQTPAPVATLAPAAPGVSRLAMRTGVGLIVLDLFGDKAPITTANFLRYVDARRYDGSNIYRALRTAFDPTHGLVQGGVKPVAGPQIPPIAHESTLVTGLKHVDGTLSLARFAVGTATSDFFICVGDAAYLDADPKASGDNAGFAAFGQVVQGMDLVRQILAMPTGDSPDAPGMEGEILTPPVPIISVKRMA